VGRIASAALVGLVALALGLPAEPSSRIKRDHQARRKFQKSHPCPFTGKTSGVCPGYAMDHATPMMRGGVEAPSNMQWQTKDAAKEMDRWE